MGIQEINPEQDIQFDQIDPGPYDPVLKCIQGDYTGRFFYLDNCTNGQLETPGEIIGGKPGYDIKANPKNISIYIEDHKIDEIHAKFYCKKIGDAGQFIVQDLSNHMNPETSGIHVQLPDNEVDILTYDYLGRELSVLNGKYVFQFEK